MSEASEIKAAQPVEDGFDWYHLEVFGHRQHWGRGREEEKFGAKMLRIDVPIGGDPAAGWETHYYPGSAIFSVRLTTEASVMQANKRYAPPSRLAIEARPEEDEDLDPF